MVDIIVRVRDIISRAEVALDFFVVLHFDRQDHKNPVIMYFYPSF